MTSAGHMTYTPATVFASDVVGTLRPDSLRGLRAAVPHLAEYVPDEPEEERLVRALVEPELEDSGPEGIFKLYYDLGLDELDPLIRQLRMVDHPFHCRVFDLGGSHHDLWTYDESADEFERVDDELAPPFPVYTLPLTLHQDEDDNAPQFLGEARFPDAVRLRAVADYLAARIRALPGGFGRLERDPFLAPLCALTGTVWAALASRENSRSCSVDSFAACIRALDLGVHQWTAFGLLVRKQGEEEAGPSTRDAPAHWTLPEWGGSLRPFRFAQGHVWFERATQLRRA